MNDHGTASASLVLIVIAILAGCGGAGSSVALQSPTALPSAASLLPSPSSSPVYDGPDEVAVGQCFDMILDKDDAGFLAAAIGSCDVPHQAELVGRFQLPDPIDAPYPGDSSINKASEDRCRSAFGEYVGVDYDDSGLQLTYYTPTELIWVGGDRLVQCIVEGTSANPLNKSVKGLRE